MATRRCQKSTLVWTLAALSIAWTTTVRAEYRESFESPDPCVKLADADCAAEIIGQQRSFQGARGGLGCERVMVRAGHGTRVYLEIPIPPAQVIEELQVRMWVQADRPGVQLLARVVLPRVIDPRSGQPVTTLVWGTSYRHVGSWEQLALRDVARLVQRQARVLGSERGEAIDVRQAYVDKIVLNAYGGPGVTRLTIDELEVDGHASPSRGVLDLAPTENWNGGGAAKNVANSSTNPAPRDRAPAAVEASRRLDAHSLPAQLHGSILMVQGRPFFPRAVVYRGESVAWLKSLGFNTLVLRHPPTPELLLAAEEHDLWLAPTDATPQLAPTAPAARTTDPPLADRLPAVPRILAVQSDRSTGGGAERTSAPDSTSRNAPVGPSSVNHLRLSWPAIDERTGRTASRAPARGDIGVVAVTEATIPLDTPAAILNAAIREGDFARQPTWIALDSELLARRWVAGPLESASSSKATSVGELRQLTLLAAAYGARGWCLTHAVPDCLDAEEIPAWVAALQAAQAELELISPWLAASPGPDRLAPPAPGWLARAFESSRSRLVILVPPLDDPPLRDRPALPADRPRWIQSKIGPTRSGAFPVPRLALVDHAAPTSSDAYAIEGTQLRTLPRQRVAGGVQAELEAPASPALVVFTQDPLVVSYLARRMPKLVANRRP